MIAMAFFLVWIGFSLFAFGWILLASLKTNQEFFRGIWSLPEAPQWGNYLRVLTSGSLGQYFGNSLFAVAVSAFLVLVLATPAAYTLARMHFRGAQTLSSLFIVGIGVPVQVIIIPLFFLMFRVGLVDTLTGLILAYVVTSLPFTIFLLRGFFRSLPSELEEAATVDGCSPSRTFLSIMLPLAAPGLLTATIFNVVWLLNEFLLSLTLLVSNTKYTLSLGLYALYGNMRYTGDWVGLFAGFAVVMVPSLLVYVFLSQRIIEGLTLGATKG
ncbi:carbohydrate ABC transporter permease [Limnochorda pilosa]|uniref:ABC transporter permease n=1 Tax=Limnochorda pilosa TaxID=1555112 RepID=A0A0K2SLM5_LIMPI|nr:carbohydrate ABC transporter permease [Limnochorda pilosa]BAS27912.1 ABC transporter permease [Limnochorda pilosa]